MGSGFAGHSSYVESTISGCSGADNRVHDSGAHLVRWNSCSQGSAVMPDFCEARRSLPTSRLLITDPHVPIWITSSLRTARELRHVHAEVAARLAEHLGVLQLIRHGHRNKHIYQALSGRRRLVNLASPVPSIPRHAMR